MVKSYYERAKKMAEGTKNVVFNIRFPPELKRWLQNQAMDNHRSLNGEVVMRLERSRQLQLQERAA